MGNAAWIVSNGIHFKYEYLKTHMFRERIIIFENQAHKTETGKTSKFRYFKFVELADNQITVMYFNGQSY